MRSWTFTSGLKITASPEPWAVEFRAEARAHRIALTYTQTRFGGRRPWFVCPSCQTHRRVVYFSGQGFACRSCLDLRYSSQIEDDLPRWTRRRRRVRDRLGGGEPGKPFPVKPKGMHWKTYRALEAVDRKVSAVPAAIAVGKRSGSAQYFIGR